MSASLISEIGLAPGLYAIDPALCAVESTVGDAWGTLFQSISETSVQRGVERTCTLTYARIIGAQRTIGAIATVGADCAVEGATEDSGWHWRKLSDVSFEETKGQYVGKTFSLCGSDSANLDSGSSPGVTDNENAVQVSSSAEAFEPARGTPLRAILLDLLRPMAEDAFGAPVAFLVDDLSVLGDVAFASVRTLRPGGETISLEATPIFRRGELNLDIGTPNEIQALMALKESGWAVEEVVFQPTEAWWLGSCERFGALFPGQCLQDDDQGSVYVQTHSRSDFNEAFRIAQELSRSGSPHVNVFEASNGWFAITGVRVPASEATDEKLRSLIEEHDLPKDSLFTSVDRFVDLRASFEGHGTRPANPNSDTIAASREAEQVPTSSAPSADGCSHLLPYPISGPPHTSTLFISKPSFLTEEFSIIGVQGPALGQRYQFPVRRNGFNIETDRHSVFRVETSTGKCIGLFRGYAEYPGDFMKIEIGLNHQSNEIFVRYGEYFEGILRLGEYLPIAGPQHRTADEIEGKLARAEDVKLFYPLPESEGGVAMVEPAIRSLTADLVNEKTIEAFIKGQVGKYEDIDLIYKGLTPFSGGFATFSRLTIASIGEDKFFSTPFGNDLARRNIYVRGDVPERAYIHPDKYADDRATTILGRIENIRVLSVEEISGGDCEWIATYRSWLTDMTPFGDAVAEQTGRDGFTSRLCFRITRDGLEIIRKEFLDA